MKPNMDQAWCCVGGPLGDGSWIWGAGHLSVECGVSKSHAYISMIKKSSDFTTTLTSDQPFNVNKQQVLQAIPKLTATQLQSL